MKKLTSNQKTVSQLRILLTDSQMYKDPDLKLETIASALGISGNTLSRAINNVTGKNFNTYINEFRVKETIKRLSNIPENTRFIHGFYKEVGFKSRSSFYRIFKNITGIPPGEYKKNKSRVRKK